MGEVTVRLGGKNRGPEMLARTGGIEIPAIAPGGEHTTLPSETDVIGARTPHPGLDLGVGGVVDVDESLPIVALAPLPHDGSEIVSQPR